MQNNQHTTIDFLHNVDPEFHPKVDKHVNICQYYSQSQFNKLCVNEIGISFIHFNCLSLGKHKSEIMDCLHDLTLLHIQKHD